MTAVTTIIIRKDQRSIDQPIRRTNNNQRQQLTRSSHSPEAYWNTSFNILCCTSERRPGCSLLAAFFFLPPVFVFFGIVEVCVDLCSMSRCCCRAGSAQSETRESTKQGERGGRGQKPQAKQQARIVVRLFVEFNAHEVLRWSCLVRWAGLVDQSVLRLAELRTVGQVVATWSDKQIGTGR